jgi:hypothetical protein
MQLITITYSSRVDGISYKYQLSNITWCSNTIFQLGQSEFHLWFKPGTSQIQDRSITTKANLFIIYNFISKSKIWMLNWFHNALNEHIFELKYKMFMVHNHHHHYHCRCHRQYSSYWEPLWILQNRIFPIISEVHILQFPYFSTR